MSGLCGIIRVDGGDVDGAVFDRMRERLRYRGDIGGEWRGQGGMIALRHHSHINSRQHSLEPRVCGDSVRVYAFAGRLDSRGELAQAFRLSEGELSTHTDQDLAIAAYERWGEDCGQHLLGAVVFVVWSPRERHLWIARDVLGRASLHVFEAPGLLVFGSDLRQVAEHPSVGREPDEMYIANLITGTYRDLESTLLRSVKRLPPAHALTRTPNTSSRRCYWIPQPRERIATSAEADEAFQDLLKRVTREHLRDVPSPGLLLSGGIDSPTILGIAREVCQQPIHTYSIGFPGLPCDETHLIDDVAERMGSIQHTLPFDPDYPWDYEQEVQQHWDLPQWPNVILLMPILRLARSNGNPTLISGGGGDEMFTASRYASADLLSSGHPMRAWQQLGIKNYDDSIRNRLLSGWSSALKPAVRSAFPDVLARQWGKRQRPEYRLKDVPRFVRQDWLDAHGVAERLRPRDVPTDYGSPVQRHIYRRYLSGLQEMELGERLEATLGMRISGPMWDARVIEFVLRVPPDAHYSDGQDKQMLRRCGHLPPSIRDRTDKAEFSISYHHAIGRDPLTRYATDMQLHALGIVDQAAFQEQLQAISAVPGDGRELGELHAAQLWQTLAIEKWLRVVSGT